MTTRIRTRLSWSDMQLIHDIIFMLSTHGWQKVLDEKDDTATGSDVPLSAIDRLANHFRFPLEKAAADLSVMRSEFEEMIVYASQFISLSTMEYQAVWWRLFHAHNSSEWSNALILARLLFSLPSSNGKLERVFSQVNLLKSIKRTSNASLIDLLTICTDNLALRDFSPDAAVNLWWEAKIRKPSQHPRKHYKQRVHASLEDTTVEVEDEIEQEDEDEDEEYMLDDWDEWLQVGN